MKLCNQRLRIIYKCKASVPLPDIGNACICIYLCIHGSLSKFEFCLYFQNIIGFRIPFVEYQRGRGEFVCLLLVRYRPLYTWWKSSLATSLYMYKYNSSPQSQIHMYNSYDFHFSIEFIQVKPFSFLDAVLYM